MQALPFLIAIALIVYFVISIVVYLGRRAENRGALRQLMEYGRALRSLSAEELSALQPFLVNPIQRGRNVQLLDDSVYELTGEFVRHGLIAGQTNSPMHDTLGGIDVVMPYDASDFLEEDNTAQVVLTRNFAIVIALNGGFSLLAGRERARIDEAQDRQWNAGKNVKSNPNDTPRRAAETPAGLDFRPTPGLTADGSPITVRIRDQRDETPNETAVRVGVGLRWRAALVLLLAFGCFFVANRSEVFWSWVLIGASMLVISTWLFWRPRKLPPPLKVNRVEGYVNRIEFLSPTRRSKPQLYLGDRFPLVIPKHWQRWADFRADVRADLAVRVEDYSVVRIGQRISVEKEETRFPSIYWGRHLLFALSGLLVSGSALLIYNNVWRDDLLQIRATYYDDGPLRPASPNELALRYEKGEDLQGNIEFSGNVRCQIEAPQDTSPPAVGCARVRWGGETPVIGKFRVDDDLLTFYSGEMLSVESNEMFNTLFGVPQVYEDESGNPFGSPLVLVYSIKNLTPVIAMIERLCANDGPDFHDPCDQIRQLFGERVVLVGEAQGNGWLELVARTRAGKLSKGSFEAIARDDTIERLRSAMRLLGEVEISRLQGPALREARETQRGGVLFRLASGASLASQNGTAEKVTEEDATDELPRSASCETLDWFAQWMAYQKLAEPDSLYPLAIRGLIKDTARDHHGELVMVIDDTRHPENARLALLRIGTIALGIMIVLAHGSLFAVQFIRAQRRLRRIAAHYAAQASER